MHVDGQAQAEQARRRGGRERVSRLVVAVGCWMVLLVLIDSAGGSTAYC